MNWYIGEEIVAIRNHSQGDFKIGDHFKITGLKVSQCDCNHVLIDIGNHFEHYTCRCPDCKKVFDGDGIWWYHEMCFTTLDSLNNKNIEELKHELQL